MSRATWLALVCLLPAHAHASPRSDPTIGRTVFTGATTWHATSLELNPAGLGLGIRNEIYLAALAAVDQYSVDRSGASTAHESSSMISPGGTIAGVWHTGKDGEVTLAGSLDTAPAERFLEDKDSLRYHILGGYHRTFAGTIGTSVRISNSFYFGLSLSAQKSYLVLRYARDTALEAGRDPARGVDSDCSGAPCGIENPAASETYSVDVNTDLFSASDVIAANVGFVVGLAKDMWLGVAYHAPPGLAIQNELIGTMQVQRAPRDGGGTVTGASSVLLSQPARVDAELRARLPRELDLHVGFRWEDLSRLTTYDVRGFGSTFSSSGLPERMPRTRGFQDSFAVWGGVEQVESGQLSLVGARIGVESSAVPDQKTTPWTIAPLSVLLDGGIQLRPAPQIVLQLTYGLQYFPSVHVGSSAFDPNARLQCFDSGFDYSTAACQAVREGYAIPSATGDYSRIEHAVRFGFRYELP
jgi:hypothetical protein